MNHDLSVKEGRPPVGLRVSNERLQKIVLRLMALVALPVLPAIIAPQFAVEKLSWLAGFGQPPNAPLLCYVTAGGSFVYLLVSVMLWIISHDVARYRPLVLFAAWACLIAGPVYGWIDSQTGMPTWWMLMDALSCLVGGAALLYACQPSN